MKASMPKFDREEDLIDSDNVDEDDGVIFNNDSELDQQDEGQIEEIEHGDEEDSNGGMSLAEASDDEDLIPLNTDMPDGLIAYEGSDATGVSEGEGEWPGIVKNKTGKRKRKREETSNVARRKRLRSLPTFASYEDYAKMIDEAPEDNI